MAAKTVIYDFGANTGGNVRYYLEKADLVVAVEANPVLCRTMEERFAAEIAAGRLIIENVVVVAERGSTETPFFVHRTKHVLSQLPRPSAGLAANFTEVVLPARHVVDIVAQYGSPHYIKIDIEHSDAAILRAILAHDVRPPYISAEAHDADIFCLLVALGGYAAFKLVDGATVKDAFAALEIDTRSGPKTVAFPWHSAGPFGNDIPGPWLDKKTFFQYLGQAGLGWKDIHASRIDAPAALHERPPAPKAIRPASAAPQGPAERFRPGYLRGEYLVLADPLLLMTASGDPIASLALDRTAGFWKPEMFRSAAVGARSLPQTTHEEPALLLSCRWDSAFYHFLYDALGKLAVAEQHGITPIDHAVYFNPVHPWQIDIFRLLGIEPRPLAVGTVHRFTRAVIPTYPSLSGSRPTRELVMFLRRLRHPASDSLPARKLFVSRGRACRQRRLDNEQEVYERCFRPLGYELVDPGALAFEEQRLLFSSATHIAGPHGAAFSLLCLGRLPLSVIELHSPHYFADCYQLAAGALGASHAAFNARDDGFYKPPHWRANFSLDPGALAAWLKSLQPGMT